MTGGYCNSCASRVKQLGKTGSAHPSWRGGVTFQNATIRSIKRAAEKRGYSFGMSTEQMVALFKSDCAYCGSPPANTRFDPSHKGKERPFAYNGIDRVDNAKGYIPGNVVACCFNCNRSKGEMSYADWIAHLEVVLTRAKTAVAS